MAFQPRDLRRCLRIVEDERKAWTFADLIQAPNGEGDPGVFDALYDTFCEAVHAPACTVTDPGPDGLVWFHALPMAA